MAHLEEFDDRAFRKETIKSKESHDESSSGQLEPHFNPGGLNWFVTGLFLVGDLVGGGIVALPSAVIQGEFWLGLFILCFMNVVACYTAYVLGMSWNILLDTWPEYRHHCRKPYPEIGGRAMGPFVRTFVSLCINVTQFGIAVVYLLLVARNIQDMIKAFSSGNLSFCILILIVAACLLPVTFLKSPNDFWWAVVIAMVTTSVAVVLVVVGSIIDFPQCEPAREMPPYLVKNFFLAIGTIVFAVGGHATLPTVQHDMENPRQFTKSIVFGFIMMAVMYLPVCIMAYLVYGDSLRDSIIPSIQTVWIQQAINILITIHCVLTLTIVFNPINQEVEELFKVPQRFCIQRVIIRTSIMLAVVFVAESVPTFGPLLDLIGGSTLALTSIVFPCVFYIYLEAYKQKELDTGKPNNGPVSIKEVFYYNTPLTLTLCIGIIIIGLAGGICATFSAILELASTQFQVPCYVSAFQHKNSNLTVGQTNCCGRYQNISIFGNACSEPNLKFYL